jgi:hypothetical protein
LQQQLAFAAYLLLQRICSFDTLLQRICSLSAALLQRICSLSCCSCSLSAGAAAIYLVLQRICSFAAAI